MQNKLARQDLPNRTNAGQAAMASLAGVEAPVFLHSMWRTGSSYLLSRFAAQPGYLTFYEPFNGEISSRRLRTKSVRDYETRLGQLRHPVTGDGYFSVYDRGDPSSGRPLWSFARPRLALFDVYNGLSGAGTHLLAACERLAKSENRTPVFGFCHSGTQIAELCSRFGGTHLYLSRPPRDQFASYEPLRNDFFIAATALQLLSSRAWRSVALQLVPQLSQLPAIATEHLVHRAPHWLAMRIGRRIWRSLGVADMYRLFYLSWAISNHAGQIHCESLFSLHSLQLDPARKRALEQKCAITLDGLRYPAPDLGSIEVDFETIEADVESLLANRGDADWAMPGSTTVRP